MTGKFSRFRTTFRIGAAASTLSRMTTPLRAPRSRPASILAFVRRTPSATLLLTQLFGILLYPWMESSPRGHTLLTIFGVIVLGVALRVVGRTPWLTWFAFVLAFVIVTLSVIAL